VDHETSEDIAAPQPTRAPHDGGERYRDRWRWDGVSKGTHLVNCWYQRSCAYNVFVKDGAVVYEEASGTYPPTNDSVPDFNPRGCQKGACYSLTMSDGLRLTHPLKRASERGEGKWRQVTWDEALGEIADRIVDALERDQPDSIVFDGNATGVASWVAINRFANILGALVLDLNTEVGDEQQGAAVTFGIPVASRSADDYFNSDLILIWGGNPAYTQIPNFHFLAEARYKGARIIAISPDFNASAVHADRWLSVNPGTDAALALSMAQVVISEGLHDADFVREQTDLPLLLRTDTREFLRESDMRRGGRDDVFYLYDEASGGLVKAPKKTLRLGKLKPALQGQYEARTRSGPVTVKPVFEELRERLDRDYTPERASPVCGVGPAAIREVAREFAAARAASGVAGASISKYYHGDLMMRAQILLFALCGQMGRRGAGYDSLPFFIVDGTLTMPYRDGLGRFDSLKVLAPVVLPFIGMKMKGYSDELAMFQLGRSVSAWGGTSAVMFWYHHGGLREISNRSREWDPHLTRDVDDYMAESVRRGWQTLPSMTPPKVLFATGSNPLRRVRGGHRLFEELLPKLDLLVATDIRMSTTALNADYVLPAASSYEKTDVNDWYTPLAPFAHVTTAAVAPPGEAKPEWEIMVMLSRKIEERAQARGVASYAAGGKRRRIGGLVSQLTFRGKFGAGDHEQVARAVVAASTHIGERDWDAFKRKGFARFTGLGTHPGNRSNASDMRTDETFTPYQWRTEKKRPWPTLTRRIQFYIDQPLYMELGEELPVHKAAVMSGGDYPLMMTGGHNRHSIHASFRAHPLMLQLERGEPAAFLSEADARARGINDGDMVRVHNDIGSFQIRAKVAASVRPGQVIVYHAWENYQFDGGIGHRNVIATPMNPVELAGGYFHIQPAPAILQPGHNDRDTRVEVVKAHGARGASVLDTDGLRR
jgi:DMSO reductase family type II enzyme molybdopterin subunit